MFVFVVQFIPFSHKTSDFSVYPRLSVLYFCCFVWDELIYGSLQGLECLNLTVSFCQTQIYVSLALPNQPFCRWRFFLGSAYFLMA